ncbi:MAG: archaeosine biosynthesis radical SAM protein RaSEA [Candidatus Lokiarchaeota archaeon]|nr:archaeosine biosynthesis radical SAM protein RaSEA [Candidatus Lokiarchaeota archaeon]
MKLRNNSSRNGHLSEEIDHLRKYSLNRNRKFTIEQLNKPVSFWIKKERLLNEIGKEFTIILRTKGCYWALEHAGCSMCGYIEDANIDNVNSQQVINQFNYALDKKLEEINSDKCSYVLKIFNSGSFFDDNEISEDIRCHIYKRISIIPNIKEVTIETRVEFINKNVLKEMQKYLENKYVELGIGLESVDDYIRNNYINKNLLFDDFIRVTKLSHEMGIGIKAYLLFKPPFLNEQGAIDDCVHSIKTLLNFNIDTISINPCNIQKGSLVEYLWNQKRYRPPWFYSLFESFKEALKQEDFERVRILCDPSGSGSKRGIHNCSSKECNGNMKEILQNFILNQDLRELDSLDSECICKKKYDIQKYQN